jgi:hypothetical protein
MNYLLKTVIFCGLILFLSQTLCAQNLDINSSLENMSNTNFHLGPTGCIPDTDIGHGDNLGLPLEKEKQINSMHGDVWARSLRFRANFTASTAYNLHHSDQLDWNKLMTINWAGHSNTTSVRLGWRYDTLANRMDVGLYGHINHANTPPSAVGREFFWVNDVGLSNYYNFELILGAAGMGVIADGNGGYIKREDLFPEETIKTAFRKRAFFGGQKCPTHNMTIRVRDIHGDQFTNWHDAACNKTFARSIFYDYDNVVIRASDRIVMSEQAYKGQWNDDHAAANLIPAGFAVGDEIEWAEIDGERFVEVRVGSELTLLAGEEIILLPGFHAFEGSEFRSAIDNSIACAAFVRSNLTDEWEEAQFDQEEDDDRMDLADNLTEIRVFPNPSTDIFHVICPGDKANRSWSVQDVSGRTVLEGETTENRFELDLSLFPNGVYFLAIHSESFAQTVKLIKK